MGNWLLAQFGETGGYPYGKEHYQSRSKSCDRIIALSKAGQVYVIPFSKKEQETFKKHEEAYSSWLPFWSKTSSISYRLVNPEPWIMGEVGFTFPISSSNLFVLIG